MFLLLTPQPNARSSILEGRETPKIEHIGNLCEVVRRYLLGSLINRCRKLTNHPIRDTFHDWYGSTRCSLIRAWKQYFYLSWTLTLKARISTSIFCLGKPTTHAYLSNSHESIATTLFVLLTNQLL
jgi:hypothetical protein